MTPRLNPHAAAPDLLKPMIALENTLHDSGLDLGLLHLVKIRASQINGCTYCVHMHTHEARKHGETEDRMHLLTAWRDSPLYSERERAALGWAEALTRIETTNAPDDVYAAAEAQFSPRDMVALTLVITTINAWNRLAIGFRSLHPAEKEAAPA